jgi:biopolymer transport protein TolQ
MVFSPDIVTQVTVDIGGALQSDVIEMVANAGPVVKFVLLLLLVFSVASWAIILMKLRLFRKARIESEIFLEAFWEGKGLQYVFRESRHLENSPLASQFRTGYIEMAKIRKGAGKNPEVPSIPGGQVLPPDKVEHIRRTLERAKIAEISRIGKALSFLATTGNSAPFIGLFGTVWGIMASFRSIGLKGAANLAVVAPGIAEALIATATGLAAAIPAVIFYNYFTNKLAQQEGEMEGFTSDFLNLLDLE